MHGCVSSLIDCYGYDSKTQEMEISFKSGGTWRYAGVPETVVIEFLRSGSKGRFFRSEIRGKYAETRL